MIRSMTGYGRGFCEAEGREVTVELKSVNHRYLDISIRLPRHIGFLEDAVRKQLSEALSRGHIDVYIHYVNNRNDARAVTLDEALVLQYVQAAQALEETHCIPNDLTAATVMRLPDVVNVIEAQEDQAQILALMQAALQEAVQGLLLMREAEGERLRAELEARADTVLALRAQIEARAPLVTEEYRQKLNERIEKLLEEVEVDRARLATEVALFADKASIDEEITRLKSHVAQMRAALSKDEPSGRKLDFIVQELNREFNTIGSKANDSCITNAVLDGKAEIEKIREQVQNIE